MMKLFKCCKRILHVVITMVVIVICCGCVVKNLDTSIPPVSMPTDQSTEAFESNMQSAYKSNPADYVVFSRSTEPREVYVPIVEIMEYSTQYPDCNGTWFKDQLAGVDLCIYNAYLYAMENCFIGFELYVEDSDRDFSYVREALCLDTPFLEQNINQYGERITKMPTNHIGKRVYFGIEQFAEKRWQMKMQALEKCREIVDSIPYEYTTQLEKMEYLYDYVCNHLVYVDYENMADQSYLYDAVCKGETVCDGYSNMLNLLFNLIGVECCEAMGSNIEDISQATPEELQNAGGHTWVVAKIDDVFYNFDPTFEDSAKDLGEKDAMFFGFSDELIAVKYPDCDDLRPKCTDASRDLHYADLIVENLTDHSEIQEIVEFTGNRVKKGQYVTLIVVKEELTEDTYSSFINTYKDEAAEIGYIETSIIKPGGYTIMKMTTEPW